MQTKKPKQRTVSNVQSLPECGRAVIRKKVYAAFKSGQTKYAAAMKCHVHERTVGRWYAKFAEHGIEAIHGGKRGPKPGGEKHKLSDLQLAELKRIIHPNGIITTKYNGKSVHPDIMTGIMGFAILYIIIFLLGSLLMTLFTEDITTSCSAVATCLSNVGPGFGSVGPMFNYAHLNDFAKVLLSLLMLIGRLEILTVMVLFTKSFWKK